VAKGKEKKVVNIWDELEGAKAGLGDEVQVVFGNVDVMFDIQFIELDVVEDVIQEYEEKKTKKPKIAVPSNKGKINIEIPTAIPKYQKFNTHKDAKKWREDNKHVDKERYYRLAYLFISEEQKPADNAEDGMERMKKSLRYVDVLKIVKAGMKVNGFNEQLGKLDSDS